MKQSLEQRKIASLVKQYEREGYEVTVEPSGVNARYKPDLVLRRGNEVVFIEVVSRKTSKEKQAVIDYLSKYAKEKGARFDLVVTNPRPTKAERQSRDSRLLQLLRDRISTELDATVESNKEAFVILCSVLVGNLLQGLAHPESVPSSERLSMNELARGLRDREIISDSALDFVNELWAARNSAVHQGMHQLQKIDIHDMLEKTRNLLKNYGRERNVI
jgi:Holliday junction resolvase